MLRVFNNTARYVDQGGNKRPGAFAVYLEPWHADVFDFLDLRKNTGKEEQVCACARVRVCVVCVCVCVCVCMRMCIFDRQLELLS